MACGKPAPAGFLTPLRKACEICGLEERHYGYPFFDANMDVLLRGQRPERGILNNAVDAKRAARLFARRVNHLTQDAGRRRAICQQTEAACV